MKPYVPLLALMITAGCHSPSSSATTSFSRRVTEAEKLEIWPENRTSWHVMIEPLVAGRTSGSFGFGPRVAPKPGAPRTVFKGVGLHLFENLPDNPPHLAVGGDLYVLHVTAGTDRSLEDQELFITIPRRIVDKPGPRKTELIIDDKGATFILGRVRRFEPWSPTQP